MAKSCRVGRDVSHTQYIIARVPTRPRPVYLSSPSLTPYTLPLSPAVSDRRAFSFDGPRAVGFTRTATRLRAAPGGQKFSHRVMFSIPEAVALCVRRKIRRENIFSHKKQGRNGQRRSRRNAFSQIGC